MKHKTHTGLVLLGALIAAACSSGSDEGSATAGGSSSDALTLLSDIEPGDVCEGGGVMVESGNDKNKDGDLDSSEVTDSVNVCAGVPGDSVDGTDGPDGTAGDDGSDGPMGADGADGMVTLTSVAAADLTVCPAGGTEISFGPDADDSGTLESSEVVSTSNVCNGEGGEGACAPVTKVTPINPGKVCEAGGISIDFGPDTGVVSGGGGGAGGASANPTACDGMLDDGEEMTNEVVCNGVEGGQGDQGDPGMDGDPGVDGDPGNDGVDGTSMAIQITVVPTGHATCANGGMQLDVAVDTNENGLIDDTTTITSSYSCF